MEESKSTGLETNGREVFGDKFIYNVEEMSLKRVQSVWEMSGKPTPEIYP